MSKERSRIAKLSRPRLYDAFPRERLFAQLDRLRAHSCIWISGPPGAGKTTLVGSYVEARHASHLWYQVDAGDSDPATFFSYLVDLDRQANRKSKPLPYLTPEYLRDLPGFTRRFFRELFARLSEECLVVLDNCQEAASETFSQVLRDAVSEVPEGICMVAISREQVPGALARLAAVHQVALLDWSALRLNEDEALGIIARAGVGEPPSFRDLYTRSGGWAAGLVLHLAHLKRGEVERSITSLSSNEAIFDYFAGEIFHRMSAQERDILMRTALLPQVTPATAATLSGSADAPSVLNALFRRQYFIDRRTEPEISYRYHDLFREFLLSKAEQTYSTAGLNEARLRAGRALIDGGESAPGIELLRQAGQWQVLSDAIVRLAPGLLAQGRWRTLQQWIRALPTEVQAANPWLLYWLGTSEIPIDQPAAQRILAEAYERFAASQDRRAQILCVSGLCEAIYFMMGDYSGLDRWIPLLEGLLTGSVNDLDPPEQIRAYSALLSALFWRQPGHPKLLATVDQVITMLDWDVDVNRRVTAGVLTLQPLNLLADWERVRKVIDRIQPLVDSAEVTPLLASHWHSFVGWYYYIHAEDEVAWKLFKAAEEVALRNNLPYSACMADAFWAFSCILSRHLEQGKRLIDRVRDTLRSGRVLDRAQFHLALARYHCAEAEFDKAVTMGRLAAQDASATGSPFMQTNWHASIAAIMADCGHFGEAESLMSSARRASAGTPIRQYEAFLLMLDAYLSLVWRKDGQERDLLRRSLTSSRASQTHMFFRYFIRDVPRIMLDVAIRENIESEYALWMVNALRIRPAPGAGEAWPWPLKIYTLGRFELLIEGKPVIFSRKSPKKIIGLLKAIVALGGMQVPERQLIDALWPEEEGDAGHEAFAIALHRLRKLFGDLSLVDLKDSRVSLDHGLCWVDLWAFECSSDAPDADQETLRLYRGPFLPDDRDEPWTLSTRERARGRFVRAVSRQAGRLEAAQQYPAAAELYQRGIEADDLAEGLYQGLMRCYQQTQQRAEGMAVYRRLRSVLSVTLGVTPSPSSERLFRAFQQS